MSSLVMSFGFAAVWGMAAIGWLAAHRVARRRGLTHLAAILDRRSWETEPVLGVRAGLLMAVWLASWMVAAGVAFAWRP